MITNSSGGGRKILDPDMELKLFQWIKEEEKRIGHHLTRATVKHKAKELTSVSDFKASKGWLDKFQKRFEVTLKSLISEKENLIDPEQGIFLKSK